jgi:pyochelin synthetase
MNAAGLLEELARLEVDVWAEGERLRYRARRGQLSDSLRERLSTSKPELLVLLRQQGSQALPEIIPDPDHWHEPFPMTDLQQAYLVGRSGDFELGNVAPHFYLEVELPDLDADRFGRALRKLIERHGMLRAIFLPDGRQQILANVPPYEIETLDLTEEAEPALSQRLQALRHRMSHEVRPPECWPVFAVRLSALPGGRWRLHMSFDLLLGDIWSFQTFFRELFTLYQDPGRELPALTISFRDCVLAARAFEETPRHASSLDYWRARVRELPPAPDLPLAVAASSLKAPRFKRFSSTLTLEVWNCLKQQAMRFGLTPSGVLLAIFSEVLAVWSRTSRFTINLTFFNRLAVHPEIDRIMGDFSSTLLLAVDLHQATFAERAAGVQEQLWNDMEHGRVSGVRVLRELARTRPGAPRASMPVVFTSALGNSAEEGGHALPQSLGEPVYGISQTPQVWIDHRVFEGASGLLFTWDVVEELFPAGMIPEMFAAYCDLLNRLSEEEVAWREPWRRSIPERQSSPRTEVNRTEAPIPEGLLQSRFFAQALQHSRRPAVLSSAREVSYGELAAAAVRLGGRLRQLGSGPNRLVAVVMEKGWEQIVALLAVLQAGAAYLPLDPSLPRERRFYLLEHAEVEIALTQPRLDRDLDWPAGVTRLVVDAGELAGEEETALPAVQSAEDLAYVIFTSGSTGLPKGVMIDHRGALNTVVDINRRFRVGPQDRVLSLSALSFDLSVWDIFGLLAAGGGVVLPESSELRDPESWLKGMRRWGVTVWNTVPALMEMLVEYLEGRGETLPESLRLVLLSGDWIPVRLPERIRRLAPGAEVVSLGGATEASIWSILYPIERVDPEWKSIPYGRPMMNQRLYVLDESLNERPDWVPGQLFIGGAGLARGYWRDEEKTRACFISNPVTGELLYRTGDMARWLPDGTIEFLGREDFQVKVQGYRVELGEIEVALSQCPGVQTAVVTAVGEPRGGKRLVGYAVPAPGAALREEELRQLLRAKLPEYMVPASLRFVESLPLTANGKVDRSALPGPLEPAAVGLPPAARSASAEKIAGLVAQCLRLGTVAVDANLRELGVTSVEMIRIANLLEKELGFRPSIDQFYVRPTADGLAALYEEHQSATPASPHKEPSARDVWASFDLVLDPEERHRFKELGLGLRSGDDHRPRVQLPITESLAETWQRFGSRRTCRSFSRDPIKLHDFAGLLGCLRKLPFDGGWKHFYPSAGGLYPIQAYLHVKPGRIESLENGTYFYQPVEHRLVRLEQAEIERTVHTEFVNRPVFDEAAFSLFLVAQVRAIAPLYGQLARDLSLIEAGAMLQLLMMEAPRVGLGLCPIGGLDFERIRPLFLLEETHQIVHSLLGGAVDELGRGSGGELDLRSTQVGEREEIEL